MIERLAVVIPARDEERLIGRCLASVLEAGARLGEAGSGHPAIDVIVVTDGCLDGTSAVARAFPGVTVAESPVGGVGAARRRGVEVALGSAVAPSGLWIANTDADSRVPTNWLTHQLDLAELGADLVVGTVRPMLDELPEQAAEAWRRSHDDGQALGHVHGANLGVRASAYLAAGGYRPIPEHEDVELVRALLSTGARRAVSDAAEVETSARVVGRTPGGYARYLRQELLGAADRIG